jgi:hypothetical protein
LGAENEGMAAKTVEQIPFRAKAKEGSRAIDILGFAWIAKSFAPRLGSASMEACAAHRVRRKSEIR